MVHVEHVMGTVVSIDVRDRSVPDAAVASVVEWLHDVDHRFSTYRDDSLVRRVERGTLDSVNAGPDMLDVLALCDRVRAESGGAFDAWTRADGGAIRFDPSAVVKGWSVDRAVAMLAAAGATDFCVNAGGDVVVRGTPGGGGPWRIGIRHPERADAMVAVMALRDCAIATSGAYERGAHIVDPRSGAVPGELASMTVIGPRLALADAYSTAAYVMGRAGLAWIAERPGYAAYAVTADHEVLYTSAAAALLAQPLAAMS